MDTKCRHPKSCFRLGRLGAMSVLMFCVATVTAEDNHNRRRRNGNSHHTSLSRNLSHHHHDQHGHHFIIHVPRYYYASYYGYGLPVNFGQYGFYRSSFIRRPYYGYGYGFGSWPVENFTGYAGKNAPIHTQPSSAEVANTQEPNGWELLADGQESLALDAFAQQARKHPNFSGPKIGYALSVAVAGDLYFGVWEMRRASRTNLSSMLTFKLPQRLRPTLEELIKSFKAEQLKESRKDDVSFMLAALHYLMQNPDSAMPAIELALREGDRSQSTRNLKRIIDQQAKKAQADRSAVRKIAGGDATLLFFAAPISGQTE